VARRKEFSREFEGLTRLAKGLETHEIELEHPELADAPEALEKIGSQLYGMIPDYGSRNSLH
jgi:hypothetical protein